MAFLITTIASRYRTTNNQFRTSSNLRNQATIQDGSVTVQQVQGRQSQSFTGLGSKSNTTCTGINKNRGNNTAVQTRAQESGQTVICDEVPGAKAILMVNHSSYDSDVILENEWIKHFEDRQNVDLNDREKYIDSQMNDMIRNRNANYAAFKKDIETLKSNLSKNVKENESLTTTIDVLKKETKAKEDEYIKEIFSLEMKNKALDNFFYKVGQSVQTMHMLTKPQVFYDNTHKQALGYQNPFYLKKAQGIKPTLYDGSVLTKKHDVMSMVDSEEKLILAEESRSKEIEKQNDSISKEKNVNICPINYADLNKLSEHFGKHFVPQKELFAEQAFWLPISNSISEQLVVQPTLVKTDIPRELPK
ncbi:hypothetical protein Tco_1477521, partial [Tanacetum coccineum]